MTRQLTASAFFVSFLLTTPVAAASDRAICEHLLLPPRESEAQIAAIHDTGNSPSCAAHATATGLENLIFVKTGRKIRISVPFLISHAARIKLEQDLKIGKPGRRLALPRFIRIRSVGEDLLLRAALEAGIVPESAWKPKVSDPNWSDRRFNLQLALAFMLKSALRGTPFSGDYYVELFKNKMVKENTGPLPGEFWFEGDLYTPRTFAEKFLPEFSVKRVLISGRQAFNKRQARYATTPSPTLSVEDALTLAEQKTRAGIAVPATFAWAKQYRNDNDGTWVVPPGSVLKNPHWPLPLWDHSMAIVDVMRGADGQVEWVKVADTQGLVDGDTVHPNKGYYFLHRSFLNDHFYRLYLFDVQGGP